MNSRGLVFQKQENAYLFQDLSYFKHTTENDFKISSTWYWNRFKLKIKTMLGCHRKDLK